MTGAEVDAALYDLARLYRWLAYHPRAARVKKSDGNDKWVTALTGDPGSPDWFLAKPPRVVLIETKGDGDTLSDHQVIWKRTLERCPGIEYYVIYPRDLPQLIKILSR